MGLEILFQELGKTKPFLDMLNHLLHNANALNWEKKTFLPSSAETINGHVKKINFETDFSPYTT